MVYHLQSRPAMMTDLLYSPDAPTEIDAVQLASTPPGEVADDYDQEGDEGAATLVSLSGEEEVSTGDVTAVTGELGQLGGYQLTRCVAAGDLGLTWEAHHVHLHRPAVIKELRAHLAADDPARERFLAAASSLARVDHPGVVHIHDYGVSELGAPYLAMERIGGESLADRMTRETHPSPAAAIALGHEIADALSAAHEAGAFHGDLEPAHIRLSGERVLASERVKIDGFEAVGRLERALGDSRCDVYSLGCILHHLACGQPPFIGDADEMHTAHRYPAPSPRRLGVHLPPGLESLILRCLAREPQGRPTMRAVARELFALKSAPASQLPAPAPRTAPARSFAYPFAAGVALGVAGSVSLASLLFALL